MRIGIYDPYLDDLGGGEKYMMTVASVLSAKHHVSVFWDDKKDLSDLVHRFSLDLDNVHMVKNIFASGVSLIEKLQESKKYDAIIILSDGSLPVLLSEKVFLHIQQPLSHLTRLSWKDRLKLKRISGVFYNSAFTKSYNDRLFAGIPSSIVYPPVALHYKKVPKENMILHVGRFRIKNVSGIDDYKKQGVMIEVFKKMVDEQLVGKWEFVLAVSIKEDDKESFALLQKSAEGYPIRFFINKTNDQLWELYNKAKIYWHASGYGEDLEAHPEYAEHFGISTVEAMGAGAVPVVIGRGGQKEIVTDSVNGLLWDNLLDLAAKTKLLMDDGTLLTTYSERARERAKDFTKEKFTESVTALMEVR